MRIAQKTECQSDAKIKKDHIFVQRRVFFRWVFEISATCRMTRRADPTPTNAGATKRSYLGSYGGSQS
jgi:hypothetical protein